MSVRKISANTKKALSRIIPELAADADLNASSSEKENNPEQLKIKMCIRDSLCTGHCSTCAALGIRAILP